MVNHRIKQISLLQDFPMLLIGKAQFNSMREYSVYIFFKVIDSRILFSYKIYYHIEK